MHPIRFILAVIFGGYAALFLAHPIAEHLRVFCPADAGFLAVIAAPALAGVLVALVLILRGGPAERYSSRSQCGDVSTTVEVCGKRLAQAVTAHQRATADVGGGAIA